MCSLFGCNRKSFYNYKVKQEKVSERIKTIESLIIAEFEASRKNYGAEKIVHVLRQKYGIFTSKRLVLKLMKKNMCISNYNKKVKKPGYKGSNDEKIENILKRNFDVPNPHSVLTTDLTYVKVNGTNKYVCFILDLFNREIVGYAVSNYKTPDIVIQALNSIKFDLKEVDIFHSDQGLEFKNSDIEKILNKNEITRSLSRPGNPYDNACSESLFHIFKEEMIGIKKYKSLNELTKDVDEFVSWYNKERLHSTLNYQSPVKFAVESI